MAEEKEFTYEYDPVKHAKDGNADPVIWSTASLNTALDAINKGLPLKANPFCGKNTCLLKPDLLFKRTQEEIDDYIKCIQDPVYFGEKCEFLTPEGLTKVKLRDYQKDYLRLLQNNRFTIFRSCRQSGKSTTTGLAALWKTIFSCDVNCLILSKSGPAGVDLIKKIKDMFLHIPYHLKPGITKWNQHEIAFDNNSSISTEAFSDTAGLGKTINFLLLDEFAWTNPNQAQLFYENALPTVTTIPNSNVAICSTQNGRGNLFYKLWTNAIAGKSMYKTFNVDWWQVPQWNPTTKQWEKRTEEWHQMMVGVLGSEEAFQYQYGTEFCASDFCLASKEALSRLHNDAVLFVNKDNLVYSTLHKECLFFHPDFDVETLKRDWFLILVDLAEGSGGDYTIFNIFRIVNKNTFVQVGYWRSNTIDLEHAALEFWLTVGQLFNPERTLISIEWNTYGALFYNYLMNLNNNDYMEDTLWRFQFVTELDLDMIVKYAKGNNEEEIAGLPNRNAKYVPGIRFNGSNKITACSLLKMEIDKGNIILIDIIQIAELENFEDKTGTGTYKASYGHDDMMMTCCQIPMVKNTQKFKGIVEDMEMLSNMSNYNSNNMKYQDPLFSDVNDSIYGGTGMSGVNVQSFSQYLDNDISIYG